MTYKNIAIAGATGRIGKPILDALIASEQFNITVLTRGTSNAVIPASVTTIVTDYSNVESMVEALKGQDVVISGLSSSLPTEQSVLIDACARAGVQRIIPSEFGSDTLNPKAAQLPVFGGKKKIQQQVEDLAAQGKLTYTYVVSGPFLDFSLAVGLFGLDLKKKKINLLDGGNSKFSTTTRDAIAKAVIQVLTHPEETKNRAVYIQEAVLTQRDLLRLSKETLGADGWTEIDAGTTQALEESSYERLQNGDKDMSVFIGFLQCAFFREGYGGQFSKLDNKLLGVSELSEEEIQKVIRNAC